MGPPPRTSTDDIYTYKYDVNEDFYLCEKCATHIALTSNLEEKYECPVNNEQYLKFEDMINVVPDADSVFSKQAKATIVRNAYCKKCYAELGFRFIKLETPENEIQAGRFMVFADKFLLWKGKKLLDAVTEQPVENFLGGVIGEPGSIHFRDGADEESVEEITIAEQFLAGLGEPGSIHCRDGENEEPIENITLAESAKELREKTLNVIRLTAEVNLLKRVIEFQAEETLPDGVTEDPVEENLPEAAATEDPVDQN